MATATQASKAAKARAEARKAKAAAATAGRSTRPAPSTKTATKTEVENPVLVERLLEALETEGTSVKQAAEQIGIDYVRASVLIAYAEPKGKRWKSNISNVGAKIVELRSEGLSWVTIGASANPQLPVSKVKRLWQEETGQSVVGTGLSGRKAENDAPAPKAGRKVAAKPEPAEPTSAAPKRGTRGRRPAATTETPAPARKSGVKAVETRPKRARRATAA